MLCEAGRQRGIGAHPRAGGRIHEVAAAALRGEQRKIDFGSQIRSYTLHPQQRAKDHRTGFEMGNVEAVLAGDLDGFIRATLMQKAAEEREGA